MLGLIGYNRLMVLMAPFVLCAYGAVCQSLPQDPRLHKEVLGNGFTFYVYQQDSTETRTDLHLIVNAGSLQESDVQRGLAHFIEHMAFNGTTKFPGNTLVELLENRGVRFGSHLNAHTGFDETVYKLAFENAETDDLAFALDVAHQWAFHLAFDSTEVDEEKGVILEEWRSKQNEERRLSESYLPLIFRDSRYTDRQPIGDMEVVLGANPELLRSFYRTWYRPDLMALAVVTPLDPERVAEQIRTRFAQTDTPDQSSYLNRQERKDYRIRIYGDTLISVQTQEHLSSAEFSYFFVLPAHRELDNEKAFLRDLHRSFFNTLASRRFSKTLLKGVPFRKGSTSLSNLLVHHDVLSGSAQLYGEELNEGISSYWTERQRIFEHGFTSEEIEKYKIEYTDQLKRSLRASRKTPSQTILDRIKDDFINGNMLVGLEDRVALGTRLVADIDSVSLQAFAQDIASRGNLILMLAAPSVIAASVPSKGELRGLLSKVEAGPGPAPWYEEPDEMPERLLARKPVRGKIVDSMQIDALDVTVWDLNNGARVYFKKTDFRKDYITLSAFRPGGIYALDPGLFLAAQHTRRVIGGSGAADISRRALSEFLRGNSASATMVISDHREGVAASADLKDIRTMFELLYLKWTQPALDTVVFQNARRDLLSSARLQPNPTPTQLLNERIGHLLTGDHPKMGEITVARVQEEFEPSRVLNAYNSRFDGAGGFQFILVGDFDREAIRSDVLTYIGGLPRGDTENLNSRTTEAVKAAQGPVHLREFGGEPGKAVVQLYFQSHPSGLQYPDLLVQKIAEEILKVRLRQRLRDENAGVYSVGANISSTNVPEGTLRTRISFSCDVQRYGFLTGQVYEVLDQLRNQPASFGRIMENIKLQLANAYVTESQRNTFWTSELRNHLYQEYTNWSYLTDFQRMLGAITPGDVMRFMDRHLGTALHIEAVLLPESTQLTRK